MFVRHAGVRQCLMIITVFRLTLTNVTPSNDHKADPKGPIPPQRRHGHAPVCPSDAPTLMQLTPRRLSSTREARKTTVIATVKYPWSRLFFKSSAKASVHRILDCFSLIIYVNFTTLSSNLRRLNVKQQFRKLVND